MQVMRINGRDREITGYNNDNAEVNYLCRDFQPAIRLEKNIPLRREVLTQQMFNLGFCLREHVPRMGEVAFEFYDRVRTPTTRQKVAELESYAQLETWAANDRVGVKFSSPVSQSVIENFSIASQILDVLVSFFENPDNYITQ
ncbi:hypothetical protein HN592_03520 [Candidatus Woesearchaeota archaeon]|nr:hypothetical protein [Candidatus Woesearchaeota archaeon]MBT4368281.1 hypothetical protein [Candidatus Woesearchaeota archaeon]MBT4712770.1 hypothetical protein [Candidatus Woesearchaeota archaeon]MBT6639682.1 hypothetical protein [Candidatus Woesearchaeota archaeon]MBT7133854.1 hypothetical protein [Candidatus Woesearchaeota archaeon]